MHRLVSLLVRDQLVVGSMATPRARPTEQQRNLRSAVNAHRKMQETETTQIAVREGVHQRQRIETESQLASDRSSRATRSQIVSTATPSSDSGIIMTTLFVVAGLVVLYILVTNPGPTTGWLGNLGTGLHALSSNKPLFTATAKAG